MQCPGCFSVSMGGRPAGGWLECDCGEKLTVIDLRDGPPRTLTVDRGSLEFVARLQPLGDLRERVRVNGVSYERMEDR